MINIVKQALREIKRQTGDVGSGVLQAAVFLGRTPNGILPYVRRPSGDVVHRPSQSEQLEDLENNLT